MSRAAAPAKFTRYQVAVVTAPFGLERVGVRLQRGATVYPGSLKA
jgi:hypothetical protein